MIDQYGNNIGRPTISAPSLPSVATPSLSEINAREAATAAANLRSVTDLFAASARPFLDSQRLGLERDRLSLSREEAQRRGELDQERLALQREEFEQRRAVQAALLPFDQQLKSAQIARMAAELDSSHLQNQNLERRSLEEIAINHGYDAGLRWANRNPGEVTIPEEELARFSDPVAIKGFRAGVLDGRTLTAADSMALASKEFEANTAKALSYAYKMHISPDEFNSDPVKKASVLREMDEAEILEAGREWYSPEGGAMSILQDPYVQGILKDPSNYYPLDSKNPEATRVLRPGAKTAITNYASTETTRQRQTDKLEQLRTKVTPVALDYKTRQQRTRELRTTYDIIAKQLDNPLSGLSEEDRKRLTEAQKGIIQAISSFSGIDINEPASSGESPLDGLLGPKSTEDLDKTPSLFGGTGSQPKELPSRLQQQMVIDLLARFDQAKSQAEIMAAFDNAIAGLEQGDYDTTFLRQEAAKWLTQRNQKKR